MLNQEKIKAQFDSLIDKTEVERARVRNLANSGRWKEAEPDKARAARFKLKKEIKSGQNGAETQYGTQDWLDVTFFTEAVTVQRAVGYVKVYTERISKTGTGFMISNSLLITNNHVITTEEEARNTVIIFNKQNDETGKSLETTEYRLDPDTFFLSSPQGHLDYSIIAIGERRIGNLEIKDLGYFILSDAPDKHVLGMNVNIIQHPLDLPKKITFRNNLLTHRDDTALLYESDTDTASSGSPVCNDEWDLIALHHWGQPYLAKQNNPDSTLPNFVNEGVRISAIYKYLSQEIDNLADGKRHLLVEALSFTKLTPQVSKKVLTRPRGNVQEAKNVNGSAAERQLDKRSFEARSKSSTIRRNEMTVTIPIEVMIRVGDSSRHTIIPSTEGVTSSDFFAEANKIDRDYSNRSGFDTTFIPGFPVPLPEIRRKSDIAPLKSTEKNAASGILKYEHFSIVLNKRRRCAFFSATNIDGETYKRVNRDTGVVTPRSEFNESEGEVWYNDERIESKYHLNQDFFSSWSHLFDRGHLTRRTDPSWGTNKIALRADADTFHFANCAIQHFRFNQTLPYWQGAERYILENGFLNADSQNHLVVFQGPIYDDDIDSTADDFQIPSKFFKIAVWDSSVNGRQSVGLIVDQANLLNEERRFLGKPHSVDSVDVSQWRASITEIEKLTGLDFGEAVRDADTIGSGGQPNVGESALKYPIRAWGDLLVKNR